VTSALVLCAVECLMFFVVTLNYRFCAKGHVTATILTDIAIAAIGFTLIRLVAEAATVLEMTGYVVGAALGSFAGMTLTQRLQERER
jgi:hypothetical protein